MTVLDVGCGIGGPAREIANLVGCTVIDVSINENQIKIARDLTRIEGLEGRCKFVGGDFMDLVGILRRGAFDGLFGGLVAEGGESFAGFDAAYAIEATCHASSLEEVYRQVSRVLKTGGVFGCSEWVMTPKFDRGNTKHVGIRNRIERGNGIACMRGSDEAREAMRLAGFRLEHEEDYSRHWECLSRDKEGPWLRPWYWPLEGRYDLARTWDDWWTAFRMSRRPRLVCYWVVWLLELLIIYPKGVVEAMTTIGYCVDSVRDGGKEEIFSPCWWFIGKKDGGDEFDERQQARMT